MGPHVADTAAVCKHAGERKYRRKFRILDALVRASTILYSSQECAYTGKVRGSNP
jgi:hypothetical protein